MKFKPLGERILVKRSEAKEKSRGGIIIPDNAKERPIEGKVVAVGAGKVLEDGKIQALLVSVGDTILFGKYSGTEVKLGDEEVEHTILREDDVLGIMEL
jgi:chaperonin GroES